MEKTNKLKNNIIILSIGILSLIIFVVAYYIKNNTTKDNVIQGISNLDKIGNVTKDEIDNIYSYLSSVDCNNNLIWDFPNNNIITVEDMEEDLKAKIVFSSLDLLNLLNDKLTKDIVKKEHKKIFGEKESKSFNLFFLEYNGNVYNTTDNNTEIKKVNKCSNSDIVSKLIKYDNNNTELYLYISVGIINNNKLYDTTNKLVGEYDSIDEMNNLLDKSTTYKYIFYRENSNLILYGVSK